METALFQTASNLKILREELSNHMELPEYFLGMHAFFDGEVVFARDVVQVNFDLSPFPVDFDSVWSWFKEQLRGQTEQETFAYELAFAIDAEDDTAMVKLMEITRGSGMTIWMIDLAHQDTPTDGKRYVVVCVPDKKRSKEFRETFHGKDALAAS
ncbi:hypothetical protein [Rhizobium leguminosarum]|uniref:hypothetical protein n=1 Tax=Rhizobium leguminosarum TaxID=384 RepID=UPI001FDFA1F3|nr:hypothetical protein [Rhizobium leguminosarum]